MKNDNRYLLFFGDSWDEMWRRRQQLAWRQAQTNLFGHVVYIERPLPVTSFLKFLVGRADRDAANRWRRVLRNRSCMMRVGENLSVLTTFAPLPLIGLEPIFRVSELVRDRLLLWCLRRFFSINQPVVWISHPQISVECVQALKPRLLWYDCTEDFSAWPGLPACAHTQIKETDRWLTSHADVVTAVSRTLYEEKRNINLNTYLLTNAVDTDLFLQTIERYSLLPEFQEVLRPVLAFVGMLNDWAHDWELLDQVAGNRPKWTFLLIGPLSVSQKTLQIIQSHHNIICVGQKPYQALPSYLAYSDICFQFYKPGRKNDSGNSQKLFLYLATGKPVVSTPSADVEAYTDLVVIVKSANEFIQGIESVLSQDNAALIKKRQAFARQNSWVSRVEYIQEILKDAL